MLMITEHVDVRCAHTAGKIPIPSSQQFVTINKIPIVEEPDPIGKSVLGCPNAGGAMIPCKIVLTVAAGYSSFVTIRGHRICTETITGLTDGTPPGTVKYKVFDPAQSFVRVSS